MHFSSFIYKPNPQKAKEDRMSIIYMVAFIVGLMLLYAFCIRGILGLGFILAVSGGLIKLKIDEIKKKGVNRFGSLPFKFTLSLETVSIGETTFKTDELSNLEIEAYDYFGGPGGDVFGSSIGTDNVIAFTHHGEKHEYQFLIKNRVDLKLVEQIAAELKRVRVL